MSRRAGRRLLWPAVSTVVMLAVLCGLGVWQVRRLHWKTALLARIDAAERAPGVPLPAEPLAFQKVRLSGPLAPAVGRYGVEVRDTPRGAVLGSQVVGVLEPQGKPAVVTLLGWLPDAAPFAPPAGDMTVEGFIRPPVRPGLFSPADDVRGRRFYTLDPAVIGPALGVAVVASFSIARLGPPNPDPGLAPVPAAALPRPPNDHLSYAITWFGLAATLLAVFAAYARKVLSA